MIATTVLIWASASGACVNHSTTPEAPARSPRSLLLAADLMLVSRVEEIPRSVLHALSSLPRHGEAPGLANPGEPFQCCCDFDPNGPPRRRLLFAAGSPHLWALYFEHGGIALERHFITFAIDDAGLVTPLESLYIQEPLATVADIKRVAASAKTLAQAGWAEKW